MQQIQKFQLVSDYSPTGDQPEAIERLVKGVKKQACTVISNIDISPIQRRFPKMGYKDKSTPKCKDNYYKY